MSNYYEKQLESLILNGNLRIQIIDDYGHKTNYMDINKDSIKALEKWFGFVKIAMVMDKMDNK